MRLHQCIAFVWHCKRLADHLIISCCAARSIHRQAWSVSRSQEVCRAYLSQCDSLTSKLTSLSRNTLPPRKECGLPRGKRSLDTGLSTTHMHRPPMGTE